MVGGWSLLGVVFFIICKLKYKEKFATLVDIVDESELEERKRKKGLWQRLYLLPKVKRQQLKLRKRPSFLIIFR